MYRVAGEKTAVNIGEREGKIEWAEMDDYLVQCPLVLPEHLLGRFPPTK